MHSIEDEKFMKLAIKEAKKALELNEVPVGCVIVKNNTVIARAHNLRESKKNSLMHAEIIAIDKACKKVENFRLEDCTMYVTLEPCLMCSGAIVQSRIKRLCFGAADKKYGAVKSIANVLELPSNHSVQVDCEIFEKECSDIIKEFFKGLRLKKKTGK